MTVRLLELITLHLATDDETEGGNLCEVVGVMPHANGFGRPDMFMANRIG